MRIITLSLHDALPIYAPAGLESRDERAEDDEGDPESDGEPPTLDRDGAAADRRAGIDRAPVHRHGDEHDDATEQDWKSTRLNSSHEWISYAVFCLKKK